MTKRSRLLRLVGCSLLMLATAGEAAEVQSQRPRSFADLFSSPEQTNRFLRGQTNGEWAAWIESRLVGSPYARALRFEEKLYRRGPTNVVPDLLLVGQNPPALLFWLGPDGLLAAQAYRAGKPFVYFPGKNQPRLLEAPQPMNTNSSYHAGDWNLNRCWFFGDVLVYDSSPYARPEYLVGLFQFDSVKEAISPNRICLELSDTNAYLVRAAQIADDRILHVGTHLLWENTGTEHSHYPDKVQGTWRRRQLRAFDLESGQLLSGSEIPLALLARHKDSVARAFGPLKFR